MSLREYIRKRDFTKTAEPRGKRVPKRIGARFVVQKHDASRLHYDFRLEMDGVLKSWAVPKGMPMARGERHLAVQVEDHPVSYIDFEGLIPKGQYGGGTVMVWDTGTFESPSAATREGLESGKLDVILHGKKLKGEWHLVQMRKSDQWLLIRGGDSLRPVSKKQDDTSALSGKTMKQLSAGEKVWQSNRNGGESAAPEKSRPVKASAHQPPFIVPMKARLVESPPQGGWIYEVKFDGFRALAMKNGNYVRLLSRNGNDLARKFREVADAVERLKASDAIIDGEIVALDSRGRSSFQLLQAFELGGQHPPLFFYAFDLLRIDGKDLRKEDLLFRKSVLERLLVKAPAGIRYSASLGNDAKSLLPKVRKLGLEGLIGKRTDSCYEPGRRSGAWIKLKLAKEQEMVIGGYTDPRGARAHFGALLIGYNEDRQLKFAGKVGTGFDERLLSVLGGKFKPIAINGCPFANLPERRRRTRGQNITPAEMKRCHWLKPALVCQVRFSEWTRDGKLRQPVFLGLREDKNASEVVREEPGRK